MVEQQPNVPIVAVVGRPNVGKSTLFNRLIQQRRAIVQPTPGITRDRIHAETEWLGRRFTLVDTGGLIHGEDIDHFTAAINRQVAAALAEAQVVIFVVDGRQGLLPTDEEVGRHLHRLGKPILLAVNKIDHPRHHHLVQDFYRLGLGQPVAISAEHGTGTGDLLDAVIARLPAEQAGGESDMEAPTVVYTTEDDQWEDWDTDNDQELDMPVDAPAPAATVRVAVLGRPNVGKSSLLNGLLGQERFIVSPIPGTTRDAPDVRWSDDEGDIIFVDTAGLRRRARVKEPTEFYSTVRALRAVGRADIVLLVLDAQELVTDQDKNIATIIAERGRGAIIVVNKWDLAAAESDAEAVRDQIRAAMPFMAYAPVVFTSALTGRGLHRLPSLIRMVADRHRSVIATPALNKVLHNAVFANQPRSVKGRRLKIRYATQSRRQPPTLLLFVNDPRLADPAYLRYLERRLREAFDLTGTPIRLRLRRST